MNSLPPATWRKNNKCQTLLIAAWFAANGGYALAQEEHPDAASLISNANLSGSLRGSFWSISNNPSGNNDIGIAEMWLKAAPRIDQEATLALEGWVRDTDVAHTGKTESVLREGYVSYSKGDADFRIGKQIIVWGRADQLNPTDNLTPRDNTLWMADSDDQRLGAWALKSIYNFSTVAVTGIWLPRFRPNTVAISPVAGTVFSENIPTGDQFALKLDQSGMAVDWSLSYFNGFDLNPDIAIQSALPNALNLSLQHHRIRVLGADGATVVGRYGLRAEAAYTWTENATGMDPFVKMPFFYGVVGADRTFFDYLNINAQYFVRNIHSFSDPNSITDPLTREVAIQQSIISNQQDRFQHGMSLRIGNKWLNETLEAEFAAVYSFTRRDYLLRPKLGYAFDDHWKGTLGANLFRGDPNTYFGMLHYLSTVYGELRYSF